MCGIASIIWLDSGKRHHECIREMVSNAIHRGPDGDCISIVGNVDLGHARLSIIDLSDRAAQPMQRDNDRITFNGEIYNYIELRTELEYKGYEFSTKSDTEVLLRCLQCWGMDGLHKLRGMFAFVFHSTRENAVYFVRDRFGIKPLAYRVTKDAIFAASEPKQIIAVSGESPKIDMSTAMAFLATGRLSYDHRTFFEGISQLEPGCMARIDLSSGELSNSRWYDLPAKIKPVTLDYESARQQTRELLVRSMALHHRADVEIGALLSGGIDSSVVVALTKAHSPDTPLLTITSFRETEGVDERHFSRLLAKHCGVQNIEIRPDTESIWSLERLMELGFVQDQPLPGGSHYNEYCVFKAARESGLSVMLSGQGADEYFGGYGEFWYSAQLDALRKGDLRRFWKGINSRAMATGRTNRVVTQLFIRNLVSNQPVFWQSIGPHSGNWVRNYWPDFSKPPTDFTALSIEEMATTSLPYQLHSEDRHSMAWGVESRLPFLDSDLVEFVMGLPIEYRVGVGYMKRILRDAIPELPETIARRRDKIGFASADSYTLWMQPQAVSVILNDALVFFGDALDAKFVRSAFSEMVLRKSWYDPVFFRIISLYAWAKAFKATP